jgi:phospholipase C
VILLAAPLAAQATGDIRHVHHVIVLMQENHSFDNYFGALPYAPDLQHPGDRGPYHPGPCQPWDHACVDGLTCTRSGGGLACTNSSLDDSGARVASFHSQNFCPRPDLRHDWPASHQEANYLNPALSRLASPNNGFVLVNDGATPLAYPIVPDGVGQPDSGGFADDTMGYFDQGDLPFYYALAQTFAIGDRYFSSLLGPTFPNRAYALAATSFGHVTTLETAPPATPLPFGGYRPVTGTIMDLLDAAGVTWANYFVDVPETGLFRGLDTSHLRPVFGSYGFFDTLGLSQQDQVCLLPEVSFIDPAYGTDLSGHKTGDEFDEGPPSDLRKGQFFVSQVVQTLRASPCWQDSVLFLTYDEHGGFYDHVAPPSAPQGGRRTPDGIAPGQCADLSNPPSTAAHGGGANCRASRLDSALICPGFTPTGWYPFWCASFDQLGFRVPFVAISPFSKPQYVSHTVADHTSLLAFIEKRFLSDAAGDRPHLTARDQYASTLEDLFDFDLSLSLGALVPQAPPPPSSCP